MANERYLVNSGNWTAANTAIWSTTSGGASGASVPTATNPVVMNAASGAVTVTIITNIALCLSLDCTGFTGTLAGSTTGLTSSGNITISTGITLTFTGPIIIVGSAIITTNAKTIASNVTINAPGGIVSLADNCLISGANATLTLTAGELTLSGKNITCSFFVSTGASTRVLTFTGSEIFTLAAAAGTSINLSSTGITINKATGTFLLNNVTSIRQITTASVPLPTLSITHGNFNFTFNDATVIDNLIFTSGGSGSWVGTSALTILGSLTLVSGMTTPFSGNITFASTSTGKTIISATKILTTGTITFDGVGGGWTLQDAVITGSGVWTLINGTLNDGGFAVAIPSFTSSNSNTRSLVKSGNWTLSSTGTVLDFSTSTGFTLTDTGTWTLSNATASALTVTANNLTLGHLTITSSSGIVTLTNVNCNNLTCTGFTGTLSDTALTIRGNVTWASGMLVMGSTSITMAATTTGKTFTSANITLRRPITFDGVGGGWTLLDSINLGSYGSIYGITLTNGSLDLGAGLTHTIGYLTSSNTNTRTLIIGASTTINIRGIGTVWDLSTSTGLTLTCSSTSIIKLNSGQSSDCTFKGGGLTYGQLKASGFGSGKTYITGNNTFSNTVTLEKAA